MRYDFDTIIKRDGTDCVKYDKRKEIFGCDNVIPMWIADMDFEVAPFINEALRERTHHLSYAYEFLPEWFYETVTGWVDRRHDWKIENDWVMYTPGAVAGFVVGELALADAGDAIVIQPPVYPPFAETIKKSKRKLLNNPLVLRDGRFEIDFEDLDNKLKGASIFMFCNPHNPTGRVFTREELTRIAELCIKHDVYIVSDEIHSDLVYKPHRHIPIASLSPEIAERTVTLIAPSKTFNVAALATSVAIIPSEKIRKMYNDTMEEIHASRCNAFGAFALKAAYGEGDEWLDQLLEYLEGNIKYGKKFLAENIPSIKTYDVEGTYLLWLDFREWGLSTKELTDFLINKAGLGLNPGESFGVEGEGYARMNLATSRAMIERAMKQLLEAYNKHIK